MVDIERNYLDQIVETHTMVMDMRARIIESQVAFDKCILDHEARLRVLGELKADKLDVKLIGNRISRLEKVEWAVGGVVSFLGLARIWQFFQGGS